MMLAQTIERRGRCLIRIAFGLSFGRKLMEEYRQPQTHFASFLTSAAKHFVIDARIAADAHMVAMLGTPCEETAASPFWQFILMKKT